MSYSMVFPEVRGPGQGATVSAEKRSDVDTRNQLIEDHLGLVHRVARHFVGRGLMFEDLLGEGALGLIQAAERFDPAVGTRFSTFATCYIRSAIRTALLTTVGTIRLPRSVCRLLQRWLRTEWLLSQLRGYPPTFEEVAEAMELNRSTQDLIARAHSVWRLQGNADSPPCVSSKVPCDASPSAEDAFTEREEQESLGTRLDRLPLTERQAVCWKYGLDGEPAVDCDEIARRLGLSPSGAQKVIARAIRKLGRRQPLFNPPAPLPFVDPPASRPANSLPWAAFGPRVA